MPLECGLAIAASKMRGDSAGSIAGAWSDMVKHEPSAMTMHGAGGMIKAVRGGTNFSLARPTFTISHHETLVLLDDPGDDCDVYTLN